MPEKKSEKDWVAYLSRILAVVTIRGIVLVVVVLGLVALIGHGASHPTVPVHENALKLWLESPITDLKIWQFLLIIMGAGMFFSDSDNK